MNPERLARGVEALRALGFEPVLARNLGSRHGYFAGDDRERLDAFHELAADPSIAAMFFARGGQGLLRLLPDLDWALLAARPRAYVGYSDLTPFLLQIVARLGLVTFHGPLVAAELERGLSEDEAASLLRALAGSPEAEIAAPGAVRPGVAEGVLLGGCLSLLAATLGTPWSLDYDGALLFWEDVAEPTYRLDRMLTQLVLSGSLRAVSGIVIGSCPGIDLDGQSANWLDAVRDAARHHAGPVAWGIPSGHSTPNHTLPLGRPARLEVTAGGGRLLIS